ncbi:MAG: acyl-CoA thioesterase [archaeon]|nr:acyl-CoA thioesterase [archaeon]
MIYAKNTTRHIVRHSDTDDWGIGYYGNYFSWYEAGRTELLKKIGINVKALEEKGTLVPVVEAKNNYFAPVKFEDQLTLESTLTEIGNTHFKVNFTLRKRKQVVSMGCTVHVFTDKKLKKKKIHEKMAALKKRHEK